MGECLTYFRVTVNDDSFSLKSFCSLLKLPIKDIKNTIVGNHFKIGVNRKYKFDCNDMVRESLKDLFGKEKELLLLKRKYNLNYSLVRVPHMYSDLSIPQQVLSLDNDIIEFLYKTEAIDDLDYYVY